MLNAVANAVLWLVARLPLGLLYALSRFVAWIHWHVGGQLKHLTQTNIRLCFPDMPETERERIGYESFVHYYKTLLESPLIWIGDVDRLRALTVEVRGGELVDEALARGKGVILAAMHLGSFEAGVIPMSERYPMTGLFKPLKFKPFADASWQGRTRFGGTVVPIVKREGKRVVGSQLLRALKRGEMIYALPDRDPPRDQGGVFAPFFGIEAHSPILIPKLAQATGATVLMCFGERLPGTRGFVLHFRAAPAGYDNADPAVAAAAINAGIEACVREIPEQYWWGYKRFKRRPYGTTCFYTGKLQLPPPDKKPEADDD